MKIRINFTISVVVAIIVSSVNARYVSQNPVADKQSRTGKTSVKQLSNTSFPISHINAVEKFTTDTTANTTLVMSAVNTTTVTFSGSITTITSTSNNTTETTFIGETVKGTTASTPIDEILIAQATTIVSLETVTENQTSTNQTTTESGLLTTKYMINPNRIKCSSEQIPNAYGVCVPIFNN
uniref:Zonadhesin n=1 Tax=Schizaphis graminum TaxID=13262 RepID=A0A2S2NVQ7_SCHGA